MINNSPQNILRILDQDDTDSYNLYLPVSGDAQNALCAVLFKVDNQVDEQLCEETYAIAFVNQTRAEDYNSSVFKTWDELESQTCVKFREIQKQLNPALSDEDMLPDGDIAHITMYSRQDFSNIVDLCHDIIKSIEIGGYEPLDARHLFRSFYAFKNPYNPVPQNHYSMN